MNNNMAVITQITQIHLWKKKTQFILSDYARNTVNMIWSFDSGPKEYQKSVVFDFVKKL